MKEFKELLASKLGKEKMGQYMRIREKNNDKLTKVYHDEMEMESYNMYEGKQLAIQMLQQIEAPHDEEFLTMIQLWNPNTWSLSPLKEMYIEKSTTMGLFAAMISSLFDIPVLFSYVYYLLDSKYIVLQNN